MLEDVSKGQVGRPLWSIEDLAKFLGVPPSTVYYWRARGRGPVAYRIDRHIRYRPEDVAAWMREHADDPPPR